MLVIAVAVVLCATYLVWQLIESDVIDDRPK
jgi:hypothetical protein